MNIYSYCHKRIFVIHEWNLKLETGERLLPEVSDLAFFKMKLKYMHAFKTSVDFGIFCLVIDTVSILCKIVLKVAG